MATPVCGPGLLLVMGACSAIFLNSCTASEASFAEDETSRGGPARESAGDRGGLAVDANDAIASFGVSRSLAGQRVADYLATMDSDREPTKKLAELRQNVEESAAELVKSYRSIALTRRIDRWKVVHTLGQLRAESAVENLKSIAFEPVPLPEKPKARADGHGAEVDPTFDQEMMIRSRAVEGIEILAREGNPTAERALLHVASSSALSARRAAVQAYLRLPTDRERRRRELEDALGPDDRWMLDLRDVPTSYFNGPAPASLRTKPPKNVDWNPPSSVP